MSTYLTQAAICGGILLVIILVGWGWANGIDKMSRDYPDYKGEDFLEL